MTTHRGWLLLSLTLIAMVLAACSSAASLFPDDPPAGGNLASGAESVSQTSGDESLAARVNGAPITLDTLRRELARERTSRQALGLSIPAQADFEREVLDQLIEAALIEQAAAKMGITLSAEALDAEVAQSVAEAGGAQSWNTWLEMSHLSLEEYRAQLRTQLLGSMITAQIAAETPATAEQVHARHILVDSEGAAQNVLNELQAGAEFAELALRYSLDASTRETGGDLAWFARGQLLEKEVEDAAFALQPGETSGIVASRLGFHIIQTLERDPARTVEEQTRQAMIQQAIEQWRQALWEKADIERFVGASR